MQVDSSNFDNEYCFNKQNTKLSFLNKVKKVNEQLLKWICITCNTIEVQQG